jgi:hypothetical protein
MSAVSVLFLLEEVFFLARLRHRYFFCGFERDFLLFMILFMEKERGYIGFERAFLKLLQFPLLPLLSILLLLPQPIQDEEFLNSDLPFLQRKPHVLPL